MGRPSRIIIGSKFAFLEVIAVEGRGSGKCAVAVCRCVCGNTTRILRPGLKKMKSCGCKRLELLRRPRPQGNYRRLPRGEAAFNALLGSYKKAAKRMGRSFRLSRDLFRQLVTSECAYCGDAPTNTFGSGIYNGNFSYNGVDRIDSRKGYTLANVTPACSSCNRMKSNMPHFAFLEHVVRICAHVTGAV